MSEEGIVNKVAKSPLVSIDLEDLVDMTTERVGIDLKDNLFQGLVLKEKDFRNFVKEHDWNQYEGKYVHVFCSTDAIIPNWAFMLVSSKLIGQAKLVVYGDKGELEKEIIKETIQSINPETYKEGKLVIKGCSDLIHPEFAFVEITKRLQPVASSIMYGEPCSTVPVFKKPRK